MTTVNGVSTTFLNNILVDNLLGDSTNVGTTLTALQNVTSNMTSVSGVSTKFTGLLYLDSTVHLNNTINVGSTIEGNVSDIVTLQQDIIALNDVLEERTTTINHQASHITALENQIEILNAQFNNIRFTNGFANQIDEFDPFGLLDEFNHDLLNL